MDEPGIGQRIAEAASQCGVDNLNALFLTPLPGTRLWDQMKADGRLALDRFPDDWYYYTLTFPVGRYRHLSMNDVIGEMAACNRTSYALPHPATDLGQPVTAPGTTDQTDRQPVYRSNFQRDCRGKRTSSASSSMEPGGPAPNVSVGPDRLALGFGRTSQKWP